MTKNKQTGLPVAIVALLAGIVACSLGCIRSEQQQQSRVSAAPRESVVEASSANAAASDGEVVARSSAKPNPAAPTQEANDVRPQQVEGDKVRLALGDDVADFWIYEDVEAGFAESQRTGKPLLVSIR